MRQVNGVCLRQGLLGLPGAAPPSGSHLPRDALHSHPAPLPAPCLHTGARLHPWAQSRSLSRRPDRGPRCDLAEIKDPVVASSRVRSLGLSLGPPTSPCAYLSPGSCLRAGGRWEAGAAGRGREGAHVKGKQVSYDFQRGPGLPTDILYLDGHIPFLRSPLFLGFSVV